MPCTNALICYDRTHKKPHKHEILEMASHVFPGFTKECEKALALACFDNPPLEKVDEMYFDTVTGELKPVIPEKNVPDPGHRAVHIMQKLRLGDMECLVLYDNGANANMVQDSMARFLELQVVDQYKLAVSGIADVEVGTCGAYKLIFG